MSKLSKILRKSDQHLNLLKLIDNTQLIHAIGVNDQKVNFLDRLKKRLFWFQSLLAFKNVNVKNYTVCHSLKITIQKIGFRNNNSISTTLL